MNGSHFDTLTKTLPAGSRRQALGGLLVASLALLGGTQPEETAAHDAKKKCQKKEGDAKKTCLKKARKHNRRHAAQTPTQTPTDTTPIPTGGTIVVPPPPTPPPATCSDGVKNRSESDVDCGGPDCDRCIVGKACAGRADCTTSNCVDNVCKVCVSNLACPTGCVCNANTGSCVKSTPVQAAICPDCPRYSFCFVTSPTTVDCYPTCA